MTEQEIVGIIVKFPFEPYRPQTEYMKKIIEALKVSQNAVLESPTGTGKTLSLLCAAMAWIETQPKASQSQRILRKPQMYDDSSSDSDENERSASTVIYASRTHAQILQAMRELKKTTYKKSKAALIASRNQLCLNPHLKQESNADKIYMCKNLVENTKTPSCTFYNNMGAAMRKKELKEKIIDIEELGSIGLKHKCCPYYITKKKAKRADIIFLPYAYLIDPKIREANDIKLKNSIVILDEGHNVGQVCEQSASTSIRSTDVRAALRDINNVINNIIAIGNDVLDLRRSIQNLKNTMDEIEADTYNGGLIFSLLGNAGITTKNYSKLIDLMEELIKKLIHHRSNSNNGEEGGNINANNESGAGLKAMVPFLQTIFSCSTEKPDRIDRCYKVYVEFKPNPNNNTNRRPQSTENNSETSENEERVKILHFWCFSPALRMNSLIKEDIRCLILTSSTLAPFDALRSEMRISAPIQLINRHIIKNHQVCARVLSSGVDKQSMDSCYNNRENVNYLSSVGLSVIEIAKVVPDGLLVFFPSYDLMNKFKMCWKERGIWQKIEQQKPIFLEPKMKDEFYDQIKRYYTTIREKKGAIFMAVLRAKISEGIDFTDVYGRAVVIVGVPFAPWEDKRIQLKKEYLNEEQEDENDTLMSGDEWYNLDAMRATNQAIGRVIRHKKDYGAIFLCDHRVNKREQFDSLPEWIKNRPKCQRTTSFSEIMQETAQFLEKAEKMLPTPENLSLNPESFILFEDDENFAAFQPEQEPVGTIESNTPSTSADDLDSDSNGEQRSASRSPSNSIEPNLVDVSPNSSSANADNRNSESDEEQQVTNKRTRNESTQNYQNDSAIPSTSRTGRVNNSSGDGTRSKPKRSRKKVNTISSVSDSSQGDSILSKLFNDAGISKKVNKLFSKYENDNDYKQFRDELFKIFNGKSSMYSLQGMTLFMKPGHQQKFARAHH